ncbi:sigma-70 family RNA polymerase sigma factor [Bariatricus massiliensis]|uniref:RNA polymerase sigma factor SigS n=1 Tax=Bariatricus massiliensis TaxID=1745713 RepID=A0ABS8DIL0_9FIRM|nr:sigma-70 family RNA polymerase sigma factor [Bariatricus massiliensis]MCB7305122.1 sigma-70 family RNA polymerase sigma factor [Bariatricus massiliensis]MCB7375770.1 sigma-70 family RNA polymerase sigma factor [Bariatricus massiliensis]MCB7388265.1 sigma-70 family RNA polymerase sigma factor [Bariatricus massiliensis]MCB7412532.1 sigma-70 family RNA polymerase sigma factor [Bariatricus massiliensis]MCQ5254074.1 sigma-70 family RNA polymerase sigma factor [Bariatricus massiliensis]
MDYDKMTDEQLIEKLRLGDKEITDYIMEKYKGLVRQNAKAMYLLGGENDDLIQEGMIGLFKAVQDYNPEAGTSFYSFAQLCISRQIYTAMKAARRKKHIPLNSYVSLYAEEEDQEGRMPLAETIEAGAESNPEEALLGKEYARAFEEELKERLSKLENRVLYLHLLGMDYLTIADIIGKSPKTVDNALQRIKAKAKELVK